MRTLILKSEDPRFLSRDAHASRPAIGPAGDYRKRGFFFRKGSKHVPLIPCRHSGNPL